MAERHYNDRADSASPKFAFPICCLPPGRFTANCDAVGVSVFQGLVSDDAMISVVPPTIR